MLQSLEVWKLNRTSSVHVTPMSTQVTSKTRKAENDRQVITNATSFVPYTEVS